MNSSEKQVEPPNLYLKLFVDTKESQKQLLWCVARSCDGRVEGSRVVCSSCDIDVGPNESRGEATYADASNRFLKFKFQVELSGERFHDDGQFRDFVARLMLDIGSLDASVVASCDFEDALPSI